MLTGIVILSIVALNALRGIGAGRGGKLSVIVALSAVAVELCDLIEAKTFYSAKIYWGDVLLAVAAVVFLLIGDKKTATVLKSAAVIAAAVLLRRELYKSEIVEFALMIICVALICAILFDSPVKSAAAAVLATYGALVMMPFSFNEPTLGRLFGNGNALSPMALAGLTSYLLSLLSLRRAYANRVYSRKSWQTEYAAESEESDEKR